MGDKRRNTELLNKIAQRIKHLRNEKGISQETFYNDTGIHIGRIENLQRDFNMTTLSEICQYLDISIVEFFAELD